MEFLEILLKLILLDIVLAGDNAVVIAMVTGHLPKLQQRKAMLFGTGGAVALRILFATVIVFLIKIPLLQAIGAILLFRIAYKLLADNGGDGHGEGQERSFWASVKQIIIADAIMSLDNVLALAGASHGNIGMIALGLVISIPIILFASSLILKLMERFKFIMYVGGGILGYTAAEMLFSDKTLNKWIPLEEYHLLAGIIGASIIITAGYFANVRSTAKSSQTQTQA